MSQYVNYYERLIEGECVLEMATRKKSGNQTALYRIWIELDENKADGSGKLVVAQKAHGSKRESIPFNVSDFDEIRTLMLTAAAILNPFEVCFFKLSEEDNVLNFVIVFDSQGYMITRQSSLHEFKDFLA